jgi:hypothetical protein
MRARGRTRLWGSARIAPINPRSFHRADWAAAAYLLVRLAKETGRFQFVGSNSPSYLWRLYKEQAGGWREHPLQIGRHSHELGKGFQGGSWKPADRRYPFVP